MKKKNIVFNIVLILCTVIFTAAAVIGGLWFRTYSASKTEISKSVKELETENEQLKNREETLRETVNSKDDETDKKNELNKKIAQMTQNIKTINSDTEKKKSEISKLKEDSDKLSAKIDKLNKGMNEKPSSSKTVKDETLKCSDTIDAGRYRISGSASFSITSVSGSARTAEDLSQLDGEAYIFEIESGESITVTGEAILEKFAS